MIIKKSPFTAMILAIGLLALSPSAYAMNCKNCSYGALVEWECLSGGLTGGASCTAGQTSCSLNGGCSNNSRLAQTMPVQVDFGSHIEAIAEEYPAVAASLAKVSQNQSFPQQTTVFWSPIEFVPGDIRIIASGREMPQGRTVEGLPIVHQIGLEALPGLLERGKSFGLAELLVLRVTPAHFSGLERPFHELTVVLSKQSPISKGSEQKDHYKAIFWEAE